ncbi:cyclohexanecarboxylate-CoA ligase [Nocardia nova]|uniref:Cyclohexanecarboxylate-CoA ligase n=1 Tax=Nocardia nova TaxID=37330 RepID=A0A2S6AN46_9NOCA|nr:AMP-binding protein [Nocardia nova]PPJ25748.1 cyclohexanecarboxylate-CoA ligase [Nocardia nova]PPJ36623.1 cyclohexanecarboxylate-CoA ligase [Nocardia nova]
MTISEITTYDPAALRALWYREGFYSDRTWPDVLAESCAAGAATTVAYAGSGGTQFVTTVGEIHTLARRVAAALQERGVRPGDTVAVQLPNRIEASIAYAAVLLAGAVLVPIVHIYGPNEVRFILEQSGAKVLVQPDRWRSVDYGDRVASYTGIPGLEQVVVVGDTVPLGAIGWDELIATTAVYTRPAVHSDDIALLIYTSGTTSAPKGVQHSHNSLLAEQWSAPQYLGSGDDAVQLVSFPPGHIAGVGSVLRPLLHGQDTVYMDTWDPALAVELVARHRVTATSGTPFHLMGMLDLGDVTGKLATLREFLIGAATVPEDLVRRAAAAGISTYRCYGSTEQPTITSGAASDPEAARLGTDGSPLPGVRVRIVDESGTDVPPGADGEVVTRGPDQFVGYRDETLNASAFTADGWMRTGDLGHLDADGRLTITDRIKDVVIRAGETISSGQLEDVLMAHPAVAEAAVVAAPDPRYGEVVAAVVVPVPGAEIDLDGIRAHFAKSGLAKQKTPERLVVVDTLPRTALGKIRKAELRAEHFPKGVSR